MSDLQGVARQSEVLLTDPQARKGIRALIGVEAAYIYVYIYIYMYICTYTVHSLYHSVPVEGLCLLSIP